MSLEKGCGGDEGGSDEGGALLALLFRGIDGPAISCDGALLLRGSPSSRGRLTGDYRGHIEQISDLNHALKYCILTTMFAVVIDCQKP